MNSASNLASPDLRGWVYVQKSGTGFKFGLSLNSGAASTYTSTVYSQNTPCLLVLRYAVAGTTNTANLYIYSGAADVAEPTTPDLTVTSMVAASLGTLNALVLRQDYSDVHVDGGHVNGVRVGSGWGSAISRPVYIDETATLTAGNYCSLTATGATIRLSASGAVLLEGNLTLNGGQIATSAARSLTAAPRRHNPGRYRRGFLCRWAAGPAGAHDLVAVLYH